MEDEDWRIFAAALKDFNVPPGTWGFIRSLLSGKNIEAIYREADKSRSNVDKSLAEFRSRVRAGTTEEAIGNVHVQVVKTLLRASSASVLRPQIQERQTIGRDAIISPIVEVLCSPDGLPRMTDPKWLWGPCWEDIEDGLVYEPPEIEEVIRRVKSESAVLVVAAQSSDPITFAASVGQRLIREGWSVFIRNPTAAGFQLNDLLQEIAAAPGPRLVVLDSVHEFQPFYTGLLERFLAEEQEEAHLLLLTAPSKREPVSQRASQQALADFVEPVYLQGSVSLIPRFLSHLCGKLGLTIDEVEVNKASKTYFSVWWAGRAVQYSLREDGSRFTAPPFAVLASWVCKQAIWEKLNACSYRERDWWRRLCVLGILGITTSAEWWDDPDAARSMFGRLIDAGLARGKPGMPSYLEIGNADLCMEALRRTRRRDEPSQEAIIINVLRDLICSGQAPKLSLLFRKVASSRHRWLAEKLLNLPTLAALAGRLAAMDLWSALQTIQSVALANPLQGSALIQYLGADFLATELKRQRYGPLQLAEAIEIVSEVDRRGTGLAVVRALASAGERPGVDAGHEIWPNSYLAEQMRVTKSANEIGHLLRAVARSARALAPAAAEICWQRLWDGDQPSQLVEAAPFHGLLMLFRGLYLAKPIRARSLLWGLGRENMAQRLAKWLGHSSFGLAFDVLGRIDPTFLSEVMSPLKPQLESLNWSSDKTFPQIASTLEVVGAVARAIAASLARSMDIVTLRNLLLQESNALVAGRALRKFDHANHVKAVALLEKAGPAALAEIVISSRSAFATGLYLLDLESIDRSMATAVKQEIVTRVPDNLAGKTAGRGRNFSGHAALVLGIASVDRELAEEIHRLRWPNTEEKMREHLDLGDASRGLRYLSEALPDRAAQFVEDQSDTLLTLLDSATSLAEVSGFLAALSRLREQRPAVVDSLLLGRESWLAGQIQPGDDVALVGAYMSALAKNAPVAAQLALERVDIWEPLMESALESDASGKLADFVKGLARAQVQHPVGALGFTSVAPRKVARTLAERICEETRAGLSSRLLEALSALREFFSEEVDEAVEIIARAAPLTDCVASARDLKELAVLIAAIGRVAPYPSTLLSDVLASSLASVLKTLRDERQIWRINWFNDTLLGLSSRKLVPQQYLTTLWESRDIKLGNIATALLRESRLQVWAQLLHQLGAISPMQAKAVAAATLRRAQDSKRLQATTMANANPVAAGALLTAYRDLLGRVAQPLWEIMAPQAGAIAARGMNTFERAWFALSVSRYDLQASKSLGDAAAALEAPTPLDATILAAAGSGQAARAALTSAKLRSFLKADGSDFFSKALVYRYWLARAGLAVDLLPHDEHESADKLDDEATVSERSLASTSKLTSPLNASELAAHSWQVYEHFLMERVRWFELADMQTFHAPETNA